MRCCMGAWDIYSLNLKLFRAPYYSFLVAVLSTLGLGRSARGFWLLLKLDTSQEFEVGSFGASASHGSPCKARSSGSTAQCFKMGALLEAQAAYLFKDVYKQIGNRKKGNVLQGPGKA